MKPLIESMSGTRGIIGENLSPEVVLKIAKAFGTYTGRGSTVIVGGDTRVSYDMIKKAAVSGLLAVGINIIDTGQVPTPTVQQMIRHYNADGGLVITASHNPVMWNGIKLMNESGSFLNDSEYQDYRKIYESNQYQLVSWQELGKVSFDDKAIEKHIDKILSIIDTTPVKNSKLKVLIDPDNGAGCLANPILLEKLGVQYEMINSEPDGVFAHNPEPLKNNLSQIINKMAQGSYDIGFAQDADADRLVILDENGRYVGEDYSFAFCVDYILSKENADNKKIVVNLSTSRVIEWLAEKYDADVTYTKIGEPYVTQKIKELKADVGGEGNGGVIYPKIGWGRDSLTGIVVALMHLAEKKMSVSGIMSQYPEYIMLRDKFEVSSKDEVADFLIRVEDSFKGADIDRQDGVKLMFENSWIHVRPSNTEPVIRIFIESETQKSANELMLKVKSC
ncbi:MAG: phosphoglucosamine mutase [bacterium]|nr:phosphoglucosamine mutase [bacterium]